MADISQIKLPNGDIFDLVDESKSTATNWVNGSQTGSVRTVGSAVEDSNYTIGTYAVAEGNSTKASGYAAHAEGQETTASGDYSHTEGSGTFAPVSYAHAEGYNTTASGNYSHAEGQSTTASNYNAHAEGQETTASGSTSHAEGMGTAASGYSSHAEGYYTLASGDYSHAEGHGSSTSFTISGTSYLPGAIGYQSHVEGQETRAEATCTHAEGFQTVASGADAHSEGYHTIASGYASHTEGQETTASYTGAHAEGNYTKAIQSYAHAEGNNTTASGEASHAEGTEVVASGAKAHAEGYQTTASGGCAHAEGYGTTVSGLDSHAEGAGTIANHLAQHVFGQYNIADPSTASADSRGNYIEIVGNGPNSSNRSNARTLDWSGNEVLAGKLTVGVAGTNSLDVATIGQLPTTTSQLTNDSGFITSYTETDPVFSASAAAGITVADISNWNANIKPMLSGSTSTITPTQVATALANGQNIELSYTDATYGTGKAYSFNYSDSLHEVVANVIFQYGWSWICCEIHGNTQTNNWAFVSTSLATMNDIPSSMVTSIATGAGLTGGTITTSGTIKANLNSETSLGTIGTTDKLYAVGVDSNGKLAVNVPWTGGADYVVTLTESWAYEATEATYTWDKTFAEIKAAIDAKKDVVLYKVSNWEDEEGVIYNDDAKYKYAFSIYFPPESEESSAWISFTAVSYAQGTWISAAQIALYEDGSVEITSGDSSVDIPTATDERTGIVKPWYYHQATAIGSTVGHDSRVITVNARTTTTGRYYGVETDANGRMFVNVPWTDSTPVTSVNGQTGTITLSASDVGAQPTLVSGTNIKTVNGNSLLGSGDITIASGLQNLVDGSAEGSLVGVNAGSITTNPGTDSLALGYKSDAAGVNSVAAGYWSSAGGNCSFALGDKLIAQRKHQTVIGKFNIADTGGTDATTDGDSAFIIGNGTSEQRSNALTVDWNGNAVLAGKVTVGAVGTNSMDVATVGQIPNVPSNLSDLVNDCGFAKIHISTAEPTSTDGDDGDIWITYSATS